MQQRLCQLETLITMLLNFFADLVCAALRVIIEPKKSASAALAITACWLCAAARAYCIPRWQ
jgi:hypothetical protein